MDKRAPGKKTTSPNPPITTAHTCPLSDQHQQPLRTAMQMR